MKKIIAMILALVMVASMAACAKKPAEDTTTDDNASISEDNTQNEGTTEDETAEDDTTADDTADGEGAGTEETVDYSAMSDDELKAAIDELKRRGCQNLKLMVLLAAPEGIQRIQKTHPDVDIYCGAVDDHLNEHGYIVPGLGDAGDRIFGTK